MSDETFHAEPLCCEACQQPFESIRQCIHFPKGSFTFYHPACLPEEAYPGELEAALLELDKALTGRDPKWAGARTIPTPGKFYNGWQFYLADGGYSRVGWNEEREALYLDSVSRDEVKREWVNHTSKRQHIEDIMRRWICIQLEKEHQASL